MLKFIVALLALGLAGSASAQTILNAPSIRWGGTYQSPGPVSIISTDTGSGLPCIAGSSSTCPLSGSGGAGAARIIIPLDVATVTTGGTAVTALAATHRSAGGFLANPIGATINLCINEQGTASGTTSAGALTCIGPGQSYQLAPNAGAVSVISSDSAHPFSGYGLN